jgi:hypothetical protein
MINNLYTLCAVEGCPFFVDDNSAYQDSTPEFPIAPYIHLTRGDAADDARDDHEPVPGETHELDWWKEHGPDRVRERFIEQPRPRQLTLSPTPLPDDHILGMREYAARIDFDGGKAELDHSFGFGSLTLALTVTFDDGAAVIESVRLNELVTQWVSQIDKEHAMNIQVAVQPEGKEDQ